MQSTKLSYARYQFLKEKGIEIDETNYRNLFIDQKHFEQQYGIKKQELLEKYAYEEENSEYRSKRTKSTQDLGRESKKAQKNIEGIDEITIKIANRLKGIDIKEATEKENE